MDKHRKKKTSIVKISEYLPGLNPEGRLFYNEYVRKYKIERGMEGETTGDDGLFHGLTLMRPASLPDVSGKEKFMFELLLPHIQTAISNAVRFTELRISAFLPDDFSGRGKPGFIIVNEKGMASFYNPKAEEYCHRYFRSPCSRIQRLAPEIRDLFDRFLLFLSRDRVVPVLRASRSFAKKIHGDHLRLDIALLPERDFQGLRQFLITLSPLALKRGEVAEGVLSAREMEIAELAVRGCSNREIADQLFISEMTVKRHLSTVYGKLRCKGRYALMAYFNRTGEIEL